MATSFLNRPSGPAEMAAANAKERQQRQREIAESDARYKAMETAPQEKPSGQSYLSRPSGQAEMEAANQKAKQQRQQAIAEENARFEKMKSFSGGLTTEDVCYSHDRKSCQ